MASTIEVTVTNDFHDTIAVARAQLISSPSGDEIRLSRHQVRRLKAALCGSAECTCSGVLGQRPGTAIDVQGSRAVWDVVRRHDGEVSLLLV